MCGEENSPDASLRESAEPNLCREAGCASPTPMYLDRYRGLGSQRYEMLDGCGLPYMYLDRYIDRGLGSQRYEMLERDLILLDSRERPCPVNDLLAF